MKWNEFDLPALRELESVVVRFWTSTPTLNDYAVGRAYDAAHQHFRALTRGRQPQPPPLIGLELDLFNAVRGACEKLLQSGANPLPGMSSGNTQPLPHDLLLPYLRKLAHSVERHTRLGGRTGYLEFVRGFVP